MVTPSSGGPRRAGVTLLKRLQSGLVRAVGSVLQLGLSLILTYYYGAALLGGFLAFVAVVNLGLAVGGGLPTLLMRYASAPDHGGRSAPVGWLWRQIGGLTAVGLMTAVVLEIAGAGYARDCALGMAVLLLQRATSSVVKSNSRPNLGILLDTALYPLLVIAFVVAAHAARLSLSVAALRLAYVVAIAATVAVGLAVTWRSPGSPRGGRRITGRASRGFYREVGGVTLGSAANVITANAPLVLAPIFLTLQDVGAFGLALRVAGFATTILVSLNAYFGPAFARATGAGELRALRRESQVASVILYLPIVVAILVLPARWLKELDPALGSLKLLILVLSVGFLVNALTGLASQLLVMRGATGAFARINTWGAGLTVLALVVGGWVAGDVGLSAGLSVAMAVVNVRLFQASTNAIRRLPEAADAGTLAVAELRTAD